MNLKTFFYHSVSCKNDLPKLIIRNSELFESDLVTMSFTESVFGTYQRHSGGFLNVFGEASFTPFINAD